MTATARAALSPATATSIACAGSALRALKRQVSGAFCKHLKAGAARTAAAKAQGLGGQTGNVSVASAAGSHAERQLFGQATPGPHPTLRPQAPARKKEHVTGIAGSVPAGHPI